MLHSACWGDRECTPEPVSIRQSFAAALALQSGQLRVRASSAWVIRLRDARHLANHRLLSIQPAPLSQVTLQPLPPIADHTHCCTGQVDMALATVLSASKDETKFAAEIPIKRLLVLLEMARQGQDAEAPTQGGQISLERWTEVIRDLASG